MFILILCSDRQVAIDLALTITTQLVSTVLLVAHPVGLQFSPKLAAYFSTQLSELT